MKQTVKVKPSTNEKIVVDAKGKDTKQLNEILRQLVAQGHTHIELKNVFGQRYIGTDLRKPVQIDIYGTPGNDLGSFIEGPRIVVHGNAQDGCGNTMNDGKIVIHGHAGDITGFAMRGGKIFVRDDVGYRVAIHMKEYKGKKPVLVIGGTAQDFLGEYIAGGILIVLGLTLKRDEKHRANFIGTGMHGGVIYLRGNVAPHQLGKEVSILKLTKEDLRELRAYVEEFASHFHFDSEEIMREKFIKLLPLTLRPYGKLYAY